MIPTQCPTITKDNRKQINRNHQPQPSPSLDKKPDLPFYANSPFTCADCYAVACCRLLCPPMEWRVSLVEVEPAKEEPCIDPFIINVTLPDHDEGESIEDLSTIKKILLLALIEDLPQAKISQTLKLTKQYVNKVVSKYQNKIVSLSQLPD